MEVWSDQPGLQFYAGNFLDGTITGKDGKIYKRRSAFTMEPQHYPDSPNHPNFPSMRVEAGPDLPQHHHVQVQRRNDERAGLDSKLNSAKSKGPITMQRFRLGRYLASTSSSSASVAWWYGRHQKDQVDFFLAGRNAGWIVIGASIFTSNIGSEHIVGLAGQGASTGLAMAHWELHAWVLILLAGLFVPFYYKSGVETIPQFLEKRFNAKARLILSGVSLVAYVFTKVSVTVYAGAIVFQALLPELSVHLFGLTLDAFWIGAFFTVIVTGIYTVFGGMRAIMYTATPQAVIILFGSFVITAIGLHKLGGWGELVTLAKANASNFALWHPTTMQGHFFSQCVSLAGRHYRLAHHRHLVLVHRPIHRSTHALGQGPSDGAARRAVRRFAQGVAGADLPRAGHDWLGAASKRADGSALQDGGRPAGHQWRPGLPDDGQGVIARRHSRPDCGVPVGRADEFTGLAVQLQRVAVHGGHL